jgi:hypothetical protein
MTILYNPSRLLTKIAPKTKIKKLVTADLTLNRAILGMFDNIDFIKKRDIRETALKTIAQYKKSYNTSDDLTKSQVLGDKGLLISRVQNAVVYQVAQEIKDQYEGEFYKWLPSDAAEPDPEHQLNYGKTFQLGDGEMPGDRYGCRCSMQILVKDDKLDL